MQTSCVPVSVPIQVQCDALPGNTQWYTLEYNADYSYPNDLNHSPGSSDEGYVIDPGMFTSDLYPSASFSGTFTYRIASSDIYNNPTKWSAPQSATLTSANSLPTAGNLTLTSTDTSITASWPASAGSSPLLMQQQGVDSLLDYELGVSTLSTSIPQYHSDTQTFTSTMGNLPSGTTYDFVLWTQGLDSPQPSDGVMPIAFTKKSIATKGTVPIGVTAPAAPKTIMSKVQIGATVADNVVRLAWTNTSNNETGFKIERESQTDGVPLVWQYLGAVGEDVTTFDDIGVRPGTYIYRVDAYNSAGDSYAYTNISVWPPGHLEAYDGTTDTPDQHTIIRDFFNDYQHKPAGYTNGVPWIPLFFGIQLEAQFMAGYTDAVNFYQSAINRKKVSLDIVGYSRGAFPALALADILTTQGVPDLSKTTVTWVLINGTKGHPAEYIKRTHYVYFSEKPKIRFIGLISPVGQSSIISELISLVTWGNIQFNPGWTTNNTSGAYIYEAAYTDILEKGVLPQANPTANWPVYYPSLPGLPNLSLSHVAISQDESTEKDMWSKANSVNVPVPKMPVKFQSGG